MSNPLGIAIVTRALFRRVQNAVQSVVAGATIRIGPPRPATPGEVEVDLYLYHVTPNGQLGNHDLPTRDGDGHVVYQPQVAIDLHYLIAFAGDDHLATEIMLGKVATTLHELPLLGSDEMLAASPAEDQTRALTLHGLPAMMRQVALSPEYLSLEDLGRLWPVFFQIPHRPSLHYVASPVILTGESGGRAQTRRVRQVEFIDHRHDRR